jgi:glutamyl-tRNA synthetase
MAERAWKRAPAIRLRVPDRVVRVVDRFQETIEQDVLSSVGDFVLKRGDGVYAYQLAVVVDDLAMGVTEVVRGADLLSSAPRQALLADLLGGRPPSFAHSPLVLGPDGSRLAKRARGVSLRDHRASGRAPGEVIADLARALGLVEAGDSRRHVTPGELLEEGALDRFPGSPSVRLSRLL